MHNTPGTRHYMQTMKTLLCKKPRDYALFLFGQKTPLSTTELLSITAGQVRHLKTGQELIIKPTSKSRPKRMVMDEFMVEAIQKLLATREYRDSDKLFSPR